MIVDALMLAGEYSGRATFCALLVAPSAALAAIVYRDTRQEIPTMSETTTTRRTLSPRFCAALPEFLDIFDGADAYGSTMSHLFGLAQVLYTAGRNHDGAREFLEAEDYQPGPVSAAQTIADLVREVGAARANWDSPIAQPYDYDVFDWDAIAIAGPVVDALPGAERDAVLDELIYAGRVLARYADWLKYSGADY